MRAMIRRPPGPGLLLALLLGLTACDGTGPGHGGIAGYDLSLTAIVNDSTAARSYGCFASAYLRLYPPLADTSVDASARVRRNLVRWNQNETGADSALEMLPVQVRRVAPDSIMLILGGVLQDTLRGRARRDDPATFDGDDWLCDSRLPLAHHPRLAEAGYPADLRAAGSWRLAPIRPVE